MTKTELAAEAIRATPNAGSLTIAKRLHAERPREFPTVENARLCVRVVRGAKGNRPRHENRGKWGAMYVTPAQSEARRSHYDLPVASPPESLEVLLPSGVGRWLVLADLHCPFHDEAAIDAMLNWAVQQRPRFGGLLLLGDVIDCYECSPFLRDPTKRPLREELLLGAKLVRILRTAVRATRTVWKLGNHDDRFNLYLMRHAPALVGTKAAEFSAQLADAGLEGVQFVNAPDRLRHRQLLLLHGHEIKGSAMVVNPARTAFMATRECCAIAHFHRTSNHAESSAFGTQTTCWSLGCLCDLHPRYAPINKWNHGFAVLDTTGDWSLSNYRILKGAVVPG